MRVQLCLNSWLFPLLAVDTRSGQASPAMVHAMMLAALIAPVEGLVHQVCRLTIYSNIRIYASMKMNIDVMETAADQASELLKALSNRHRLLIVCQLIDGERSVGDLAEFLGLRDSTVSQHLALLRKDGLVSARRDAQTIHYSIASDPAREVLTALYRVYCAPSNGKASKKKATRG